MTQQYSTVIIKYDAIYANKPNKKCQHCIPACGVNGVEVIRCRELCKKCK